MNVYIYIKRGYEDFCGFGRRENKANCRSFYVFSRVKTIPMWRGHLALVLCRRQDAGGTQGRDGLATIGMRLPPDRID